MWEVCIVRIIINKNGSACLNGNYFVQNDEKRERVE